MLLICTRLKEEKLVQRYYTQNIQIKELLEGKEQNRTIQEGKNCKVIRSEEAEAAQATPLFGSFL